MEEIYEAIYETLMKSHTANRTAEETLRRAGVQKGTTGNAVSAPWRPQVSLQSQWEGDEQKKNIPKIYVFLQPKTRGRLNVLGRRLSFCKHRPQK